MFVKFDTIHGIRYVQSTQVAALREGEPYKTVDYAPMPQTILVMEHGGKFPEIAVFGAIDETAERLNAAENNASSGLNLPEYLTRHVRKESAKEAIPESFPVADPTTPGQEVRAMEAADVVTPKALPEYVPEAWNDVPCEACLGTGNIWVSGEKRALMVECVTCSGNGFVRTAVQPTDLDEADEITYPQGSAEK